MPGASFESLDRRPLAIGRRQVATIHASIGLLVLFVLSGSSFAQPSSQNRAPASDAPGPVTFNRDIAPVIFKNCSPCHRPTQPGPFNLLAYADVKKRAEEIAKVTAERTMPPWLPDPGFGEFKEERRLSEADIRRIQTWVKTGVAEGNSADLQ